MATITVTFIWYLQGGEQMTTYMAKKDEITKNWYILDAEGKPLGRVASEAARLLRGKHKAVFTPHVDTGDFVIIVNADKIVLTGKKLQQKLYTTHSGYPGGLKTMPYEKLMKERPELAVEKAVKGMLPHNRLGRAQGRKLKVYQGTEHPHAAQLPVAWEFAV
jgi:large subunit ribosomal protein L13